MRHHRLVLYTLLFCFLTPASVSASPPKSIADVATTPPFFNPAVGQTATITFRALARGTAKVTILDRDRFAIRTLPPVAVEPGPVSVTWDGRDDRAAVVPDEAWNIRIELAGDVYDPSRDFMPVSEDPQPRSYSRIDGVLSFRLSRPSRVHIEAGQSRRVGDTYSREGPILKTIVDREPRVAGAIVERWNGFDESGTIRVSSLPDFVLSVLATSLPDNSLITRGNRKQSFVEYARQRRPESVRTPRKHKAATHHHSGLNVFEDQSPALQVKRTWSRDGALRLEIRIDGPDSAHFLQQPGNAAVYVDESRVAAHKNPSNPIVVTIPAKELAGRSRVVVNWGSEFGPVATSAFLLERAQAAAGHKAVTR